MKWLWAVPAAAIFFAAASFAIIDPARAQTGVSNGTTVVVGRISGNPKKQHPRLEAMGRYLAPRLGALGYAGSKVVVVSEPEQMALLMGRGEVDLISETPFTALDLERRIGARLLLHEWKNGEDFYRSVIFTRQDARVFEIGDLKDRKIAFEDRGSTSAFLVPFTMLRARGLTLRELKSPMSPVPAGSVGYTFALREKNMVVLVGRGMVDAGAFSRSDWDDFSRSPEAVKGGLRIVAESEPIVRSLLVVRSDLDAAVQAAIKDILLSANAETEGKEVLRRYNKVTRYTEFNAAALASLQTLRATVAAFAAGNKN